MKKQLLILMTLCISIIGYSQSFTVNNITYQVTSTTPNTVQTTSYNTAGGTVVIIPTEVVNNSITYSVTNIRLLSFSNKSLTSVTFASPSNVTNIGNSAFKYNGLTSIIIPNSVTNIEGNAFQNNSTLTCVISESIVPPIIVSGGNDSFGNLNRVNIHLTIPTGTLGAYVTDAGALWTGFNSVAEGLSGTFVVDHITYQILSNPNNEVYISDYDTAGGSIVDIPATVVSGCTTFALKLIGVEAFMSKNLTQVTIADGLTEISVRSFKDNQLANVVIPNSVTVVSVEAFRDNVLTSLALSDNLTTISSTAFLNNLLQSVILPDGITSIANNAFGNNQLQSIVIPDNVISIGSNAFGGNQLTSLTLGTSLTTIGSQAFISNSLTSVIIPDNVTDFGERAFQSNQLTSVTLGTGDTSIGEDSFRNNEISSVIIPNIVTSIGPDAFANNQLTSIIIPNSVTSISTGAFNINNLNTIVLSDNLVSIGASAFSSNNLTSITIPANVTNIGILAFGSNPNLNAVTSLAITPPTISTGGSQDTFGNFALRPNIDLYIPVGTTASYVTDSGALWTNFNSVTEGTLSTSDFELVNDIKVITTQDAIKIIASNSVRLENYTMYSITGAKVTTGTESEISTGFLSRGIYILKLDFDKGTVTKKVAIN